MTKRWIYKSLFALVTYTSISLHSHAMSVDFFAETINNINDSSQTSPEQLSTTNEIQQNKSSQNQEHEGLNIELQDNINEKLVLLKECKKSNQHVLSYFSILINHINKLDSKYSQPALEQTRLEKLFQTYKSLGGLENSAKDVRALPDPCEPVLTEIRANVDMQLNSQRAERPKFSFPVVDFKICNKPDYPPISVRNEEHGSIRLAFLIETDGSISSSFQMSSTGSPFLDAAAFNALSKCQFKPGIYDGKPIRSWSIVDYNWVMPT
ncbi:TonB family C-terminal domain [Solimicrobium silvestre]|uniref:TonB family C-terminal domain n=2 Tax=Solimicrobium silvestre TaxID=2099400 RepID=A0A2S9GW10_9BURK|nr:TonB family C-terminal domain [Solimicrobium silvestre]